MVGVIVLLPIAGLLTSDDDPAPGPRTPGKPATTEPPTRTTIERRTTTTERRTTTEAPTTRTTEPAAGVQTVGQYEFRDVQVREDYVNQFEVRARVTNTGPTMSSVSWTATVFNQGAVVGTLTGYADSFEAGETITVTFIGLDDYGAWDRVEFQTDFEL